MQGLYVQILLPKTGLRDDRSLGWVEALKLRFVRELWGEKVREAD